MGIFKKLFGKKQKNNIQDWPDTPAPESSEQSKTNEERSDIVNESMPSAAVNEPMPSVVDEPIPQAVLDTDQDLAMSDEANDMTHEIDDELNYDTSLIEQGSSELLGAEMSLAEKEMLEELKNGEPEETAEDEWSSLDKKWGGLGAPAKGRRVIALFRDRDDLPHQQLLKKRKSMVQGETSSTNDEDENIQSIENSEDVPTTEEVNTHETTTATAEEVTAEEVTAEDALTEDAAAEDTSTEEAPAEEVTAEDTSTEKAPTEEVTAEEAPAEEAPAEETPAEDAPAEEVSKTKKAKKSKKAKKAKKAKNK